MKVKGGEDPAPPGRGLYTSSTRSGARLYLRAYAPTLRARDPMALKRITGAYASGAYMRAVRESGQEDCGEARLVRAAHHARITTPVERWESDGDETC